MKLVVSDQRSTGPPRQLWPCSLNSNGTETCRLFSFFGSKLGRARAAICEAECQRLAINLVDAVNRDTRFLIGQIVGMDIDCSIVTAIRQVNLNQQPGPHGRGIGCVGLSGLKRA